MIPYIVQVIAFQLFFLLIYDLFLKKETFFNWNRAYLLGTSVLSFLIPFIKINSFKEIVPQEYIFALPEVVIGNPAVVNQVTLPEVRIIQDAPFWTIQNIFIIGASMALLVLMFKMGYILRLLAKNPKRWKGDIVLVKLLNSLSAFSFLHYVFLGEKLNADEQETILKHEMVHVRQKHSYDLLYFEVLRVVFWFNPLVYMYQNRMRSLHEFIADQEALKTQTKKEYYQSLLSQMFETQNVSFINTFFKKSLIKKRIIMLQKNRSEKINLLKYLFLVPIVLGMLVYTSSYGQEKVKQQSKYEHLSVEELKDVLRLELITLEEKEGGYVSPRKFIKGYDQLMYSREDFYRSRVLVERIFEEASDSIRNSIRNRLQNTSPKTYNEYVEWVKTDRGKEHWESQTKDGILRFAVNDFYELTKSEKEEKERKINIITKDDYWHSLLISDGENSSTIVVNENNIKQSTSITTDHSFDTYYDKSMKDKIYEEYLKVKNNVEAKSLLEDDIKKGILRLFVTDINNLTLKEQRLLDEKKKLLNSGVYFSRLIMENKDKSSIYITFNPNEIEVTNNRDDLKAVVLNDIDLEVGFEKVQQPPVFEGCENEDKKLEKKCTSDKIAEHVQKNFNTDLATNIGLTGKQRISVLFKINKEGIIEGVRARAAHPDLETEAIRVIKTLPQMTPGEQKGKTVIVPYSLPIVFQIVDDKVENKSDVAIKNIDKSTQDQLTGVPFHVVNEPPVFKGCELEVKEDQKKCTSDNIHKFVVKNFNTNLAKEIGLSGRQRILVVFKINDKGTIEGVKIRAPHPALEEETKRVITSIPQMIPGKHNGEEVAVTYSLPIVFEVFDNSQNMEVKKAEKGSGPFSSFSSVEQPPIMKGCENGTIWKQRKCTTEKISKHVQKKFNKKLAKDLGLEGTQKILVNFNIDEKGKAKDIKVRAPHPDLEKEAIKAVKTLPKLIPATQNGVKVKVDYFLPITFKID